MRVIGTAALALVLTLSPVEAAQEAIPSASQRIPHLKQRLASNRWEVRYCLLHELTGTDPETKQALETLVRDPHPGVANQATVRYVSGFLQVEKSLFKPRACYPDHFPLEDLPKDFTDAALVDYLLGRGKLPPLPSLAGDSRRDVPVLDAKRLDDSLMHSTLTIVGILGRPEDAPALHPFLDSPNSYVATGAARAVLRLGDRTKAVEALCRIARRDPAKELYYVTEALRLLRQAGHPGLREMVLEVLSVVDRAEKIQPNWVSAFVVLAAEIAGDEVWRRGEAGKPADAPK